MDCPEWLEALLYDWRNEHLLRRQRLDQDFYSRILADREAILVLGSGTGRIATPIGQSCSGTVLAVDRSIARLRRAPHASNVVPVGADIRRLPFSGHFSDAALYPYSTFQMLQSHDERILALTEARRALRSNSKLYIDVSTSFEENPADRHERVVLVAPCTELATTVTEVNFTETAGDHVALTRTFSRGGEPFAEFTERWFFASELRLPEILPLAGFQVDTVLHGYGDNSTEHRRIYVASPARQ